MNLPKLVNNFKFVKKTRRSYQYQCRCGKKKFFTKNKILNKEIKCSCHSFGGEEILNKDEMRLFKRYIDGAKKRGLKFELTQVDFKELIYQQCQYCGIEPKQKIGKIKYNGIDRFDSEIGYDYLNTRTCCSLCNRAKSNMGHLEFYTWIDRISGHQKDKNFVSVTSKYRETLKNHPNGTENRYVNIQCFSEKRKKDSKNGNRRAAV